MKIDDIVSFTFDEAVFKRPSLQQILADGIVSEMEIQQQSELTKRLFDELKESLSAEQVEKLTVLMEEMGVLFTISLFHNFKSV